MYSLRYFRFLTRAAAPVWLEKKSHPRFARADNKKLIKFRSAFGGVRPRIVYLVVSRANPPDGIPLNNIRFCVKTELERISDTPERRTSALDQRGLSRGKGRRGYRSAFQLIRPARRVRLIPSPGRDATARNRIKGNTRQTRVHVYTDARAET